MKGYHRLALALVLVGVAGVTGCGRGKAGTGVEVSYADFVRSLADPLMLARLDAGASTLISSYDPSGGNNDFNNFVGVEPGWVVLADLQGPGYVSRFWTTGGLSADQRLRFIFEDEATPRIDATVRELREGFGLLRPPLARYEQSCWWTYTPLTFRHRLRILAEHTTVTHEGWPRLFYQVNWTRTEVVPATFPVPGTPGDVAALAALASGWETGAAGGVSTNADAGALHAAVTVAPGATMTLFDVPGPAVIRELELVTPDAVASAMLTLQIVWDEAAQPSVDTPLNAFFGGLWQRVDMASKYLEWRHPRRLARFPMPFRSRARVLVVNQGTTPLAVEGRVRVERLEAWDAGLGYLHAAWRHTTPSDRGRPHRVAAAEGRGKYVGCVLAVSSAVPSWWVLEADETMTADGAREPQWRGTGLEDYFNGAWYYKNNLARPLHGLTYKRPFVAVQYRFHEGDAFTFRRALEVAFERGPDQASPAWMESVGYFYLAKPGPAGSDVGLIRIAPPPQDPFELAALMTALGNYERQGAYAAADAYVADVIQRYPTAPWAAVLRLRRLVYRERMEGFAAVEPAYREVVASGTDPASKAYAALLLWFHEDPSHALLSLFCGSPTEAFVDGQRVATTANPAAFMIVPVQLPAGAHVLSLRTGPSAYPEWVQACLRTHSGLISTTPEWQYAFMPGAGYEQPGFDASGWGRVEEAIREGPPPVPHIQTSPHPFVDMQALPAAIWTAIAWPAGATSAVFRQTFQLDAATEANRVR